MKSEVLRLADQFARGLNARVAWGNGYTTCSSVSLPGPVQLTPEGPARNGSWPSKLDDYSLTEFAAKVAELGAAPFVAAVDSANETFSAKDNLILCALRRGLDMIGCVPPVEEGKAPAWKQDAAEPGEPLPPSAYVDL